MRHQPQGPQRISLNVGVTAGNRDHILFWTEGRGTADHGPGAFPGVRGAPLLRVLARYPALEKAEYITALVGDGRF